MLRFPQRIWEHWLLYFFLVLCPVWMDIGYMACCSDNTGPATSVNVPLAANPRAEKSNIRYTSDFSTAEARRTLAVPSSPREPTAAQRLLARMATEDLSAEERYAEKEDAVTNAIRAYGFLDRLRYHMSSLTDPLRGSHSAEDATGAGQRLRKHRSIDDIRELMETLQHMQTTPVYQPHVTSKRRLMARLKALDQPWLTETGKDVSCFCSPTRRRRSVKKPPPRPTRHLEQARDTLGQALEALLWSYEDHPE